MPSSFIITYLCTRKQGKCRKLEYGGPLLVAGSITPSALNLDGSPVIARLRADPMFSHRAGILCQPARCAAYPSSCPSPARGEGTPELSSAPGMGHIPLSPRGRGAGVRGLSRRPARIPAQSGSGITWNEPLNRIAYRRLFAWSLTRHSRGRTNRPRRGLSRQAPRPF